MYRDFVLTSAIKQTKIELITTYCGTEQNPTADKSSCRRVIVQPAITQTQHMRTHLERNCSVVRANIRRMILVHLYIISRPFIIHYCSQCHK
jgi:hypothetical protein